MLGLDSPILATATALVGLVLGLWASGHALLHKRRPESAFGWVGVCMLFPFGGALMYYVFGVNRVQTRALKLRPGQALTALLEESGQDAPTDLLPARRMAELARIGARVGGSPAIGGNRVTVLHSGEDTYPAMLDAIDLADRSVYLSTYIFESNRSGLEVVEALHRARERGVDVRVLLDGVGELYTFPRLRNALRKRGIRYARFLPPRLWPPTFRINLRNHRKILVTDNRVAFVGGINIGDRHLVADTDNPRRVVDLHFRFEGPIAEPIAEVFASDWEFATGEPINIELPDLQNVGDSTCRVIVDGPDGDLDRMLGLLLAAVAAADRRVAIMTPYFLPPRDLMGALQAAALRGVDVALIMPGKNNLPYVHRATRHMLWELLRRDVKIYYQPGPFVHSKLLLIDDGYAFIGSANWDARSLRLNYELGIEIFDEPAAGELGRHFEDVRARSQRVTAEELNARNLPTRLVDGLAWLLTPYL